MSFNHLTGVGCRNDDDCHGGYRRVTEHYVNAVAPVTSPPYPELGARPPADAPDALVAEWERRTAVNLAHALLQASKRDAAANSSYPCPNCNPDQFIRWQAGQWPYPPRGNVSPVIPNEAPEDDQGLFADLATPYAAGAAAHVGEDF